MREDMFELIIERPRGGNWPRKPGRRPRDLDDAPRFESSSRNRGGTKWLNENLAPLVRFLRRRVGRPWNEVHAEIAKQLSLDSAVQKHVLDHVWQMIDLHPQVVDGKLCYSPPWYGGPRPIAEGSWQRDFYVCPQTGRLMLAPPPRRRPRPEPSPDRLRLDDTDQAFRIDGIWYRVRFAPVPARRVCLRDVILKRFLNESGMTGPNGALAREYGRDDRYAVSKQQMSSREIAALSRRR
jgi:hypothetical protein